MKKSRFRSRLSILVAVSALTFSGITAALFVNSVTASACCIRYGTIEGSQLRNTSTGDGFFRDLAGESSGMMVGANGAGQDFKVSTERNGGDDNDTFLFAKKKDCNGQPRVKVLYKLRRNADPSNIKDDLFVGTNWDQSAIVTVNTTSFAKFNATLTVADNDANGYFIETKLLPENAGGGNVGVNCKVIIDAWVSDLG